MLLMEEYVKRHNLSIPVVRRNKELRLILYSNNLYRIFAGTWVDANVHPGYYRFSYLKPNHNSSLFCNLLHEKERYYWDEYESFILEWIAKISKSEWKPVSADYGHRLVVLTLWRIFLYSCESAIVSEYGSKDFFELIYNSTCDLMDLDTRMKSYNSILELLSPNLLAQYRSDYLCHSWYYADWLVELIENAKLNTV